MAQVTRTTVWQVNQKLASSALNNEFNHLLDNAQIVNADIASGAAISISKISTGLGGGIVGTSDAQTLTNKTIDYNTNTILNLPIAPTVTDGWITASDTLVYVSASSFKISGVDRTTIYTKGTRVKFTNNSATFYGTVASSAFSTDTTVTLFVTDDFSINNSAITNPFYSYQINPQGYPGRFQYTPSYSASGGTWGPTNKGFFSVVGRVCLVSLFADGTTSSGTQELLITLPVAAIGNQAIGVTANDGGGLISGNAFVADTLNVLHINKFDGSAFGAGVSRTAKVNFPYFY